MKWARRLVPAWLALIAVPGWGGPYDASASKAASWLLSQQNAVDGSWGTAESVKYVHTSEAVLALAALNRRTPQYYAGLNWLQNHAASNVDYAARRTLAIKADGGVVSPDLQVLMAAQALSPPSTGGWGLSRRYQSAALDSALALQAYNQAGVSSNVSHAVNYLVGSQLAGSDKGWVVGQATVSDPITTAHVLIALTPLVGSYASLPAVTANGLSALNSKVTTASPVPQKALAAIANLRNNPASTQATTLLSNIAASQNANGSWGNDVYATALAARSLAAGMATDLAAQRQAVNLPDNALRAAINRALGRNAMDMLNIGELAQLTTLIAPGAGISDLTGLQYATNLTYIDLSNNPLNVLPSADSDADTVTDLNEIAVGTNPYNAASKPWLKNEGPKFDYAALVAATPTIGMQEPAWHAVTDDFDHDGDMDLFLYFQGGNEKLCDLNPNPCEYGGPDFGNLVFLENVSGSYLRRAFTGEEDFVNGDIEQMVPLDYNNDGKVDLLLVTDEFSSYDCYPWQYCYKPRRRLVLFRNDSNAGVAHFSDVTTAVGLDVAAPSWYAEGLVMDLNQDGYPDILGVSQDSSGNVLGDALVYNKTSNTYTPIVTSGLPRPLWFSGLIDLNSDGKLDIVAQDGTLGLRFFRNNGNASFTELTNTQNLSSLVGKWVVSSD